MICSDAHPAHGWCDQTFTHINYYSGVWVRNIARWLNHVARDRRQIFTKAEFMDGGTVEPAPKRRR